MLAGAMPQAMVSQFSEFDLKGYLTRLATRVNEALDASIPVEYPQVLTESMR
jgi:hypothetical protein